MTTLCLTLSVAALVLSVLSLVCLYGLLQGVKSNDGATRDALWKMTEILENLAKRVKVLEAPKAPAKKPAPKKGGKGK